MAHLTLLRRVQKNLCTILVLALAACELILPRGLLSAAEPKEVFSLQNVINKAQDLAKKPFQERQAPLPDFLLKLKYDDWREIRFDPEQALWLKEKLPFNLQFFHPGLYYTKTVNIYTIDSTGAQPVPFSAALFNYGKNDFKDRVPPNLGFAGFRIHFPINVELTRTSGRLSRRSYSGLYKNRATAFRQEVLRLNGPTLRRGVPVLYGFLDCET
jgi:glucan biosynthesis protein